LPRRGAVWARFGPVDQLFMIVAGEEEPARPGIVELLQHRSRQVPANSRSPLWNIGLHEFDQRGEQDRRSRPDMRSDCARPSLQVAELERAAPEPFFSSHSVPRMKSSAARAEASHSGVRIRAQRAPCPLSSAHSSGQDFSSRRAGRAVHALEQPRARPGQQAPHSCAGRPRLGDVSSRARHADASAALGN